MGGVRLLVPLVLTLCFGAASIGWTKETRIVRVQVVDSEGRGVPRWAYAVRPAGADTPESRFGEVHESILEISLPQQPMLLFVCQAADPSGRPLALAHTGPIPISREASELRVQLANGVALSGKVMTASGHAANDVKIEALAPQSWLLLRPSDVLATSMTDGCGSFRLLGLAQGSRYRLRLVRGEQLASVDFPVASPGEEDLVVTLREPMSVALSVINSDGTPVAGTSVSARKLGPGGAGLEEVATSTTDKSGVAVLRALDSRALYLLRADPPVGLGLAVGGDTRWTPHPGTIRLERGWTLRGHVHDSTGTRRPAVVWCERLGRPEGLATNADGSYEIANLPLRPVLVVAVPSPHDFRQDLVSWTRVSPTTDSVRLLLVEVPDGALVVQVVAPSGQPVDRALLVLSTSEGEFISLAKVRSGKGVARLPDSAFSLDVYDARSAQGDRLPLGAAWRDDLPRTSRSVRIQLRPHRTIQGRVVDLGGRPVSGAWAEAYRLGHVTDDAPPHAQDTTNEQGTFELGGLGSGRYLVRFRRLGPPEATMSVEVMAGAENLEVVFGSPSDKRLPSK